ncbi:MAG: hypothetical protein R3C56_15320 [Pirellulaceae bacterium]
MAIHLCLASVLASVVPVSTTVAAEQLRKSPSRPHAYGRSILHISLRGELYATLHACIWNAGKYPNRADYEIEFLSKRIMSFRSCTAADIVSNLLSY